MAEKNIKTKEEFLNSTIKDISQVYLGKDNHCRCGCGGDYTATSFMKNPRTEDINDELVLKRLIRAKQLVQKGAEVDFGGTYVNVVTGKNRALCFYFDDLK